MSEQQDTTPEPSEFFGYEPARVVDLPVGAYFVVFEASPTVYQVIRQWHGEAHKTRVAKLAGASDGSASSATFQQPDRTVYVVPDDHVGPRVRLAVAEMQKRLAEGYRRIDMVSLVRGDAEEVAA